MQDALIYRGPSRWHRSKLELAPATAFEPSSALEGLTFEAGLPHTLSGPTRPVFERCLFELR